MEAWRRILAKFSRLRHTAGDGIEKLPMSECPIRRRFLWLPNCEPFSAALAANHEVLIVQSKRFVGNGLATFQDEKKTNHREYGV
jgi:hypothetical protein